MRTPGQLIAALDLLLAHDSLVLQDADAVAAALARFRAKPALGFPDCLVLEIARKAGHLWLATFEKTLGRLDGAQRLQASSQAIGLLKEPQPNEAAIASLPGQRVAMRDLAADAQRAMQRGAHGVKPTRPPRLRALAPRPGASPAVAGADAIARAACPAQT